MSLPHALLTSLSEQPGSGSELASRFDRSIGYFWQATHQQIYRELARLVASGWIEALPEEDGRGRKRRYLILPAGRDEMRRWNCESQTASPIRDELMVRLRAEAAIGPTGLRDELVKLAQLHRKKLAKFQAIETRDFSSNSQTPEQMLQHLVLKSGLAYESQRASLCEEAIAILDQQQSRIIDSNQSKKKPGS